MANQVKIGRDFLPGDAGFGAHVLILAVDQKGVVGFGAGAVVSPAGAAEVAGEFVIVGTEIAGPADAAGVEDEAAEIEMGMLRLVIAALGRDVEGGGVFQEPRMQATSTPRKIASRAHAGGCCGDFASRVTQRRSQAVGWLARSRALSSDHA